METFGDRLQSERQGRGLTIRAVAEALHVDPGLLRALEHNDFDALPDESTMMACLQAYADCLRVDADLMIEDYLQERETRLRRPDIAENVAVEQVAETAPAAIPVETEHRPRFSRWMVVLVVVAIALLAAWWILARDGTTPTPERSQIAVPLDPPPPSATTPGSVTPTPAEPPPSVAPTPVEPPVSVAPPPVQPLESVAPTPAEPPPAESAPTPPGPTTRAPSLLSVTEYGVGTAVENRQLVGQSDRFTEGTQVWFLTRARGGSRGDRIEHVWLREGAEVSRVSLPIGGPSWRTFSKLTLQAGVAGDWAVEARDGAGLVLARREFVCVP